MALSDGGGSNASWELDGAGGNAKWVKEGEIVIFGSSESWTSKMTK